ncbi:hypothetical protein Taro_019468 [Colocasia esculenta]|uniref:Retrotransposon gag domain-containing protein n=1 Tax=Colocasia esculenta TaxID=4460 RepID=A0A843UTZ3_COLES|nr:hypothetical protein [Colocasia esculenta]
MPAGARWRTPQPHRWVTYYAVTSEAHPYSPQARARRRFLYCRPVRSRDVAVLAVVMADRRDWGGGGDDPEESTQWMIERIWESLTEIRMRMDQQAPIPPVTGVAVPVAPVPPPPGVEVPFVAPILPSPPVIAAEEPVVQVERFLRLQPPTYTGGPNPDTAEHWIHEIERVFMTMRCPAADKVVLATFQLRGFAQEWWRLKMQTTFAGRIEGKKGAVQDLAARWDFGFGILDAIHGAEQTVVIPLMCRTVEEASQRAATLERAVQTRQVGESGKGRGWGGRQQVQQGRSKPEVEESQQSTARQPTVPPGYRKSGRSRGNAGRSLHNVFFAKVVDAYRGYLSSWVPQVLLLGDFPTELVTSEAHPYSPQARARRRICPRHFNGLGRGIPSHQLLLLGLSFVSCLLPSHAGGALSPSADSPTAYEELEQYGFPRGILPEGVKSNLLRKDGTFEAYLGGCSNAFAELLLSPSPKAESLGGDPSPLCRRRKIPRPQQWPSDSAGNKNGYGNYLIEEEEGLNEHNIVVKNRGTERLRRGGREKEQQRLEKNSPGMVRISMEERHTRLRDEPQRMGRWRSLQR